MMIIYYLFQISGNYIIDSKCDVEIFYYLYYQVLDNIAYNYLLPYLTK